MDPPRFRTPLARTVLDDPAFSPDPRSHPHFPLANARFYKAVPSDRTSSSSSSSSSSDPDSLASPSPTVSSATSPSHSPSPSPSHSRASPVSPSVSPLPKVTISKPHPPRPPLPQIRPKSDTPNTVLKPISTNIPRKARMKAFVRRLTTRHNLDRIDELDETDPFGGGHHHDGPYEAVASNLTRPTIPPNTAPRRAHHLSTRESDPLPLRPTQHRSTYRAPPFAHGENGLSLHLQPGQILQSNTIYSSHLATITAAPGQFFPQPNTVPAVARPDPSRRQSLPNPRTRHRQGPSPLDIPYGSLNRQSLSLHAPRERYRRDCASDTSNDPPSHHDHDAAPYIHQKTVFTPPRYESRLCTWGPPRSPQHTPPPSFSPTSPQTQSTENTVPASRHDSRHKTIHSLDSSHAIIDTFIQPSSSIQSKPLESVRIRHLPKRLVMPAPLQPKPPHPHYEFPPAELPSWPDEHSDDHALEGAHFQGKPAMYSEEPKLLRKKSSAFPAKLPIPDHAPMSHDDAVPIIENPSTNEMEGTKERTRRRRLSKRKNDI